MSNLHRVEIVRYSHHDDGTEAWTSPSGSVRLIRRRGEDVWRATIDRYEVIDAQRLNGASAFEPRDLSDAAMVGTSAQGLSRILAMQEGIHLLFDA